MKSFKFITTLTMLLVSISASAEAFYIEDQTIVPGEEATLSVVLKNEADYTSFQFDVYLPDGLEYVNDAYDELDVTLASRIAKHTCQTGMQTDGAMRFVVYSGTNRSISGTEGTLLTFNVKASEDYSGTQKGRVSYVIFALNQDGFPGVEFEDSEFNLIGPDPEPDPEPELYTLRLSTGEGGSIATTVKANETFTCTLEPEDGWFVSSVLFNDENCLASLDEDNVFTTPEITADSRLSVVFEKSEPTEIIGVAATKVAIRPYAGGVAIDGADNAERATVYNLKGEIIYDGLQRNIPLAPDTYILTIGARTFKFAI